GSSRSLPMPNNRCSFVKPTGGLRLLGDRTIVPALLPFLEAEDEMTCLLAWQLLVDRGARKHASRIWESLERGYVSPEHERYVRHWMQLRATPAERLGSLSS